MSGMQEQARTQVVDYVGATAEYRGGVKLILNQVENGVAVRMAVLYLLAGENDLCS
jgi:aspartate carbamoyltransferase catalytic subunit